MSSAKNDDSGEYWLAIYTYLMYKYLRILLTIFLIINLSEFFLSLESPTLEKLLPLILWEKLFQVKGPLYVNDFVPKWVVLMWGIRRVSRNFLGQGSFLELGHFFNNSPTTKERKSPQGKNLYFFLLGNS